MQLTRDNICSELETPPWPQICLVFPCIPWTSPPVRWGTEEWGEFSVGMAATPLHIRWNIGVRHAIAALTLVRRSTTLALVVAIVVDGRFVPISEMSTAINSLFLASHSPLYFVEISV